MTVGFLRELPSSPVKGNLCLKKIKLQNVLLNLISFLVRFNTSNIVSPLFPPAQADSYREGYEACLQRVSALLPRTSLDYETCARVHDFIQQAKPSSSSACRSCSARNSIQHERLQSPKSNPVLANRASITGSTSSRAHALPQAAAQTMWRPW